MGALLLVAGVVLFHAVTSNHATSSAIGSALDERSRRDLGRLPWCAIARKYGVAADVLAGVVLAEKQLNRDWSDDIQDGLFELLLVLRSEEGWHRWADEALAAADRALPERSKSREWPAAVAWSGVIFSLGPSQITPRTAFRACRNADRKPGWCGSPRELVRALMDETLSLEVAALVLDDERRTHLAETGVDVSDSPGRWATLYNFGGEIFRARFRDHPDRPANGFGQWVDRNSAAIRTGLHCPAAPGP